MPSATTSKKDSPSGTKRKAESTKDNGAKKPKVGGSSSNGRTDSKPSSKKSAKSVPKPTKVQEESSEDDFDAMDQDGGVPLQDSEDTDIPMVDALEGVHPDRVKAYVAGQGPNGMLLPQSVVWCHLIRI
jgi:hypothetical protein